MPSPGHNARLSIDVSPYICGINREQSRPRFYEREFGAYRTAYLKVGRSDCAVGLCPRQVIRP